MDELRRMYNQQTVMAVGIYSFLDNILTNIPPHRNLPERSLGLDTSIEDLSTEQDDDLSFSELGPSSFDLTRLSTLREQHERLRVRASLDLSTFGHYRLPNDSSETVDDIQQHNAGSQGDDTDDQSSTMDDELQPRGAAPGGYPEEIFMYLSEKEKDEFVCKICYSIVKNAYQCANEHKFCYGCIYTWSTGSNSGHDKCPTCRCDGMYAKNTELSERINRKRVSCAIDECNWMGFLSNYGDHYHRKYTPSELDQLVSSCEKPLSEILQEEGRLAPIAPTKALETESSIPTTQVGKPIEQHSIQTGLSAQVKQTVSLVVNRPSTAPNVRQGSHSRQTTSRQLVIPGTSAGRRRPSPRPQASRSTSGSKNRSPAINSRSGSRMRGSTRNTAIRTRPSTSTVVNRRPAPMKRSRPQTIQQSSDLNVIDRARPEVTHPAVSQEPQPTIGVCSQATMTVRNEQTQVNSLSLDDVPASESTDSIQSSRAVDGQRQQLPSQQLHFRRLVNRRPGQLVDQLRETRQQLSAMLQLMTLELAERRQQVLTARLEALRRSHRLLGDIEAIEVRQRLAQVPEENNSSCILMARSGLTSSRIGVRLTDQLVADSPPTRQRRYPGDRSFSNATTPFLPSNARDRRFSTRSNARFDPYTRLAARLDRNRPLHLPEIGTGRRSSLMGSSGLSSSSESSDEFTMSSNTAAGSDSSISSSSSSDEDDFCFGSSRFDLDL